MMTQQRWIGFLTLLHVEVRSFARKWIRFLLPPALTVVLYFVIFGGLVGSQIRMIDGFTYMQYITPGLIMMAIVMNAYTNTVGALFLCRFHRGIEELAAAPLSNMTILLGYVLAATLRGLTVGFIALLLALFFAHLVLAHVMLMLVTAFLAAVLFSLLGFLNGLYAKNFDDISIVPTFVLTPLTYFGGVFYSIHMLPHFWQKLSYFNPIFYIINVLRYAVLGIADVSVFYGFSMLVILVVSLFLFNLHLLNKGVGIRT